MWYQTHTDALSDIGYATSTDGISWTKQPGNPVLSAGPEGAWDGEKVADPNVLFDGTTYHMWYAGNDGSGWQIGYATSTDGVTWTKSPSNPVLTTGSPGDRDEGNISEPNVLYENGVY